ncbi:peptidoglycan DD-metalloendopeptidase family protein [Yimella sp. cx-51]|uniref:peptidoglycan DD-metalloendopeptidase family protein n=1 Tax=Yimella sp. cx-51 TaxID=2770551 RepID=UPI00165E31FD|nr:peptidoglycan DD-metalloendopeptidase family protein [Yimella sp. cx-51]MBC9956108.1 peptidoglycan DD-metalloendopeptidase family protein [Yimella sp. cx-51]QTH37362.1 peptidoglycan DD-metalloendopeptidase family protein [Yimella sp. cx-51]
MKVSKGVDGVSDSRGPLNMLMRRGAMATVAIMFLPGAAHAVADDPAKQKDKIDKQIVTTQGDLDAVSTQLRNAVNALAKTDAQLVTAGNDLKAKNSQLTTANNNLASVNSQLKIAQGDESRSRTDLTNINTAQQRTKKLVGGVARQSYMTGGLGTFDLTLQILMSKKDPANTMSMADIIMRQQNGVLTTLAGQKASKTATVNRLGAATRRVAQLKVQAGNAVTSATTARNNAQTAKNRLDALRRTQSNQKASLEKQKRADLNLLAWQKGESRRLGKILIARAAARAKAAKKPAMAVPRANEAAGTARAPVNGNGFLNPPAPINQIISPFGMRNNPVLGIWLLHAGVDYPMACGTPIYASAAGEVITASYEPVAGNYIMIDHGFVRGVNLATHYAHLSRFVVTGGAVSKGQLIGYSGTTGRSTGCHLHFGTLNDGQLVDPMQWFR